MMSERSCMLSEGGSVKKMRKAKLVPCCQLPPYIPVRSKWLLPVFFLLPLGDLEMDLSGDIQSHPIPSHPVTFRFECSKLLQTLHYCLS